MDKFIEVTLLYNVESETSGITTLVAGVVVICLAMLVATSILFGGNTSFVQQEKERLES